MLTAHSTKVPRSPVLRTVTLIVLVSFCLPALPGTILPPAAFAEFFPSDTPPSFSSLQVCGDRPGGAVLSSDLSWIPSASLDGTPSSDFEFPLEERSFCRFSGHTAPVFRPPRTRLSRS